MSKDPRPDVLRGWLPGHTWKRTVPHILSDLDAADPLRRALTPGTDEHEAMVERVAKVLEGNVCVEMPGGEDPADWQLCAKCDAAAVLAALRDLA